MGVADRRARRKKERDYDSDDEPDIIIGRDGRSSHSRSIGSKKSFGSHAKKSFGGGSAAGRSFAASSLWSGGQSDSDDDEWDTVDTLAARYLGSLERTGEPGRAAKPNAALLAALKDLDAQLETRKRGAEVALDLSKMHVGHNHVLHLCRVLQQGCPLTALSLKGCHLHSTVVPCLVVGLLRGRLQRLDLSDNPSLCYLAGREVLTLLKRKPRLTSVDVSRTGMHPATLARIDAQAAKNAEFVRTGGPTLPAVDPFAGYHMPRSFLSVHYPPVLLSFSLEDAGYVRQLCNVLSKVDPRLAGAFATFHHRKTSPDYQTFIKTCFIEADYVLVVLTKNWVADVQCKAEVTWFRGRTDLVVLPEMDASLATAGCVAVPGTGTETEGTETETAPSAPSPDADGAASDASGGSFDHIAATDEKLATFHTASSAFLPPPEPKALPEVKCMLDTAAAAAARRGPLPVPMNLRYIPAEHRFYLPREALEAANGAQDAGNSGSGQPAHGDTAPPSPTSPGVPRSGGDVDGATPCLVTAFLESLCQELRSSQSFQLPPRGGIQALSRWRKTFVFITQSLTADNPTHVSLYPRLVKRMQQHRKENVGEPYLPHIRQLTRFEEVIQKVLASNKAKEKEKTTGLKGQGKRKKHAGANVTQTAVMADTGSQGGGGGRRSPKGKKSPKRGGGASSGALDAAAALEGGGVAETRKTGGGTRMNIYFDLDENKRFFYARHWRTYQKEGRIAAAPPPLVTQEKLYVPNPQRLRLRQILAEEERRVAKERGALTRECRALRISQRSLASNVRLINRLENQADEDKARAGEPLQLLLPHIDPAAIREVRALKEPRLTDNVRMCAKAVLMITDDTYLDKDGNTLAWWWDQVQAVFSVENQLLYRIAHLPRVRKRQWTRIKEFLTNPSFTQDHASVPHEVWGQEALHGARPRGAIALLARWLHCVYNQYIVNVRLENDVYRYVDDLHDEYKHLSDRVTGQEQKVNLLQIGVGYLQHKVGEIIKDYTRTETAAGAAAADDGDAPDPQACPHYRVLRRCALLQALPNRLVAHLASHGAVVRCERRAALASDGNLYVVLAGRLMLSIESNDVGRAEDLYDRRQSSPRASGAGFRKFTGLGAGGRLSNVPVPPPGGVGGAAVAGATVPAAPTNPSPSPSPQRVSIVCGESSPAGSRPSPPLRPALNLASVRFAAFEDGDGGLQVTPQASPRGSCLTQRHMSGVPSVPSLSASTSPSPANTVRVRLAGAETPPEPPQAVPAGRDSFTGLRSLLRGAAVREGSARSPKVSPRTSPQPSPCSSPRASRRNTPNTSPHPSPGPRSLPPRIGGDAAAPTGLRASIATRSDSVSTTTQSVRLALPGPGAYASRRSMQSWRSLGTGTETSMSSNAGATSTLSSGQWVHEEGFLRSLNAMHAVHATEDTVRVVSMGESRSRPTLCLCIPRSAVPPEDRPMVYDAVKKARDEHMNKARKALFLQQLPLLKGVGVEVLLSIAPAVDEISYLPDDVIVRGGAPTDALTIVTTGGVVMNDQHMKLCYFPAPEDVVKGAVARHEVRADEHGCVAYSVKRQALLSLGATCAALRDKLTTGSQESPSETIHRVPHDAVQYPYQDLNDAFQTTLAHTPRTRAEAAARQDRMRQLKSEFMKIAVPLAEMIISEVYMNETPERRRLPAIYGARNDRGSGGQRYVCNGMLFEVASNKGNLYGDIAGAAKALKHEFRAWEAVLSTDTKGLCVPLAALVTFKGFRLKALPLLPLAGRETVVYGGCDGTRPLDMQSENQANSPEVSATLKSICAGLNLKGHRLCGSHRLFYGPADVEVRRGLDGRYYLLRPGRLFPCSNVRPGMHSQGQWLVQLMRPELVASCKRALSSDAFTRWGTADRASDDPLVAAECRRLHTQVLPAFAAEFAAACARTVLPVFDGDLHSPELVAPFSALCTSAHARGINVRHFAALVALMPLDAAVPCTILHIELVARTFKSTLAKTLRALPKPTTENCDLQTTHLLSQLFGNGPSNTAFWRDTLYPTCKDKFGFASLETFFESLPTMHITTTGVGRVEYIGFTEALQKIKADAQLHMLMLARVCDACGLRLSQSDAKAHAQRVAERSESDVRGRKKDSNFSKKMSGHRISSMSGGSSARARARARNTQGRDDTTESVPFHFLDGTVPVVHCIAIPKDDAVHVHTMNGRLDLAERKLLERIDAIKAVTDEESGSLVRPLMHLAGVYRTWGRHGREGEVRERALDLCTSDLPFDEGAKAKQHSLDEAEILMELAEYHSAHSTAGRACHAVTRAEAILTELGFDAGSPVMQRCLFVAGRVQEVLFNHSTALDAYTRIRDAATAAGVPEVSRTRVLASVGVAKALAGNFELTECVDELKGLLALLDRKDSTGSSTHSDTPAAPSEDDAERAHLLCHVLKAQYSMQALKAEHDHAFNTLQRHVQLWWRWIERCSGSDLLGAVDVLVADLSAMHALLDNIKGLTSRFDDALAGAVNRLPEVVVAMEPYPHLLQHPAVPPPHLRPAPADTILRGCVSPLRWAYAAALTVRAHYAADDFEGLEKLMHDVLT